MYRKVINFQLAVFCGLLVAFLPVAYNSFLLMSGQLLEYRGGAPGRLLIVPAYFLILPIMISVAVHRYKKSNSNLLLIREALIIGLIVAFIAIGTLVGYDLVFNSFLAPSFYSDYYNLHEAQMLESFLEPRDNDDNPLGEFEDIKNSRINNDWKSLYIFDVVWGSVIWIFASVSVGLILRTKASELNSDPATK